MIAAPPVVIERFRVEHGSGFTMSVVSLIDRRAAGNRVVRFVYQRHHGRGMASAWHINVINTYLVFQGDRRGNCEQQIGQLDKPE